MNGEAAEPGHVIIIHGVLDSSRPDEQDTLDQVREAAAALSRLGFTVETLALSLDLSPLASIGGEARPVVFNLVEALDGDGALIHLAPAVMEHLGLAFTGSGASALAVTTDKQVSKQLLSAQGIACPATAAAGAAAEGDQLYIVKSVTEDASFGLDEGSVVAASEVAKAIAARTAQFGGQWFAEAYIEGREFNLSLIEDRRGGVEVLPIAEILFEGFGDDRPRIVDYASKWEPESFGYRNTPRRFIDETREQKLATELRRVALAVWDVLGLAGYGRVDFRVDANDRVYVLEANANPCLSRDAGFVAAAFEAGIGYDELIGRIVANARMLGRPQRIAMVT